MIMLFGEAAEGQVHPPVVPRENREGAAGNVDADDRHSPQVACIEHVALDAVLPPDLLALRLRRHRRQMLSTDANRHAIVHGIRRIPGSMAIQPSFPPSPPLLLLPPLLHLLPLMSATAAMGLFGFPKVWKTIVPKIMIEGVHAWARKRPIAAAELQKKPPRRALATGWRWRWFGFGFGLSLSDSACLLPLDLENPLVTCELLLLFSRSADSSDARPRRAARLPHHAPLCQLAVRPRARIFCPRKRWTLVTSTFNSGASRDAMRRSHDRNWVWRLVELAMAGCAAGGAAALSEREREVQRQMPVVNVREFGAVADGTTDDSAAFRAALARAAHLSNPNARAIVIVPGIAGGRYLVANVSLPADVDVVGRGTAVATILMPASALFALQMNSSTTLRNVHFDVVSSSVSSCACWLLSPPVAAAQC
eukprot:COSAG01_NODE_5748_length_4061_cov_8.928067_4_plen_423_part_00